ncbi:hypothetical protein HMF7854_05805 [Sphingomonas ginkgonis]|uniref:Oxidoreductase molybdopterin-binding domain-containing protein n=1 Tax=Sphingomonas ginkgonis TaxID=2315330 RepID=A0A429V8T7_9SPHN|nr:molybdopterin-dependent oxidoreductase [Sphingomonas ginkgonis]RST30391.1 hypothetical protein HMF7854_05805 [Sphingomonas ginkgonis]
MPLFIAPAAAALVRVMASAVQPSGLLIEGVEPAPIRISGSEIAALSHVSVSRTDHGKPVRCEGVPLAALLARVKLPSGEALRGKALTTVIVASARDGYRVSFSLGELDPELGKAGAVVADRCNGRPLDPSAGPLRLILPNDQRPARSVRQLERLSIVQLP